MANRLKYRKAWRFPEAVEDFIASQCEGYTVHLMCGESQLGDLRVDKYVETADIQADVLERLPIADEIADTVVCDPPWEMDNRDKPKLMSEIKRILKFGGKLIFNSTWNPKCPGLGTFMFRISDTLQSTLNKGEMKMEKWFNDDEVNDLLTQLMDRLCELERMGGEVYDSTLVLIPYDKQYPVLFADSGKPFYPYLTRQT